MCNYDSNKQQKINRDKQSIPIICLNTGEVFDSIKEASRIYNIDDSSIIRCCKGRHKSAGKNTKTGEKLRWMYFEEYLLYKSN